MDNEYYYDAREEQLNNDIIWGHISKIPKHKPCSSHFNIMKLHTNFIAPEIHLLEVSKKNSDKAHFFIINIINDIDKNSNIHKFRNKPKQISKGIFYNQIKEITKKEDYGISITIIREITFSKDLFERLIEKGSLEYTKKKQQWE